MSSFEKETVWCFFTGCENVETLAINLGLDWSKLSSKPFSILAIFPEVPVKDLLKSHLETKILDEFVAHTKECKKQQQRAIQCHKKK